MYSLSKLFVCAKFLPKCSQFPLANNGAILLLDRHSCHSHSSCKASCLYKTANANLAEALDNELSSFASSAFGYSMAMAWTRLPSRSSQSTSTTTRTSGVTRWS
mmetsp:Transcript_21257/g.34203  ORF Transcript_21257/g.34203 Transcript_21257/m.34203 type:complete len:104 (-) Transcript_21257:13-324(-)